MPAPMDLMLSAVSEKRYLSYQYFVHVPIGIAGLVLAGRAAGWFGWVLAIVLFFGLWLLVMFAGLMGAALGERENRRLATAASADRPTPTPPADRATVGVEREIHGP